MLGKFASKCEENGILPKKALLRGPVLSTINSYIKSVCPHLLIIGPRGGVSDSGNDAPGADEPGADAERLSAFGVVTDFLLRNAPCPVLKM